MRRCPAPDAWAAETIRLSTYVNEVDIRYEGFKKFAELVAQKTDGRVKVEVFPETDLDFINITTVYRGASPAEVEEAILQRIEESIAALQKMLEILGREVLPSIVVFQGLHAVRSLQGLQPHFWKSVIGPAEAFPDVEDLVEIEDSLSGDLQLTGARFQTGYSRVELRKILQRVHAQRAPNEAGPQGVEYEIIILYVFREPRRIEIAIVGNGLKDPVYILAGCTV